MRDKHVPLPKSVQSTNLIFLRQRKSSLTQPLQIKSKTQKNQSETERRKETKEREAALINDGAKEQQM